ncbi:uncharacterized protein LOC111697751 isoform X2 [Eurytemora carolleeae]|uniref:uncharacterized protein LOC111697751 isoform X2 n=1 Tax=Eurytemora carolleeae TaxID=1294199 RepID=UPI000C77E4F9|nr:uncharacterized protein LOC111697751 isoform X2 [Eurytemora carolleeae]|eukprot:XP_023323625.1 uncharacterized protein LOC111697751 isoform X2 [Eurytemora affinis]
MKKFVTTLFLLIQFNKAQGLHVVEDKSSLDNILNLVNRLEKRTVALEAKVEFLEEELNKIEISAFLEEEIINDDEIISILEDSTADKNQSESVERSDKSLQFTLPWEQPPIYRSSSCTCNQEIQHLEDLVVRSLKAESMSSRQEPNGEIYETSAAAQLQYEKIFSNLTKLNSKILNSLKIARSKTSKDKSGQILGKAKKVNQLVKELVTTNITVLESAVEFLRLTTTSALLNIDACMKDPTSATCTVAYGDPFSLPATLKSKCDGSVCSSLKSCMENPSSVNCTVIYGTNNSLPGVLAGKCDGSTCAVLKSDLSTVQTCFKDPSDVACTGTYSTENSLPAVISGKCEEETCSALNANLATVTTCLVNPTEEVCIGDGLLTWAKYLKQPSVQCALGVKTGPLPFIKSSEKAEPNSCSVLPYYYRVVFNSCIESEPPNVINQTVYQTSYFHVFFSNRVGRSADSTDVQINQDGWYQVEMSTFMTVLEAGSNSRIQAFRVSKRDPLDGCADISTQTCSNLITQDTKNSVYESDVLIDAPYRSEGAFQMCAGDKIILIFSKDGDETAMITDSNKLDQTILTVTKLWYTP